MDDNLRRMEKEDEERRRRRRIDNNPLGDFVAEVMAGASHVFTRLVSNVGKASIAGTMAGICEETAGYPLDIIKTRMQVHHSSLSAVGVLRDIIMKEGFFAVFSGLGSPVASSAFINSALFGTYGKVLENIRKAHGDVNWEIDTMKRPTAGEAGFAGLIAGFVQSFIACPVEVVKARMQVQGLYLTAPFLGSSVPTVAGNSWQMTKSILKGGGVKAIYKGMVPTLLRDVPGFGLYFASYETLKELFWQSDFGQGPFEVFGSSSSASSVGSVSVTQPKDGVIAILVAGGISGMLYQLATYPIDVVKSHVQIQSHHHHHHYLYKDHSHHSSHSSSTSTQQSQRLYQFQHHQHKRKRAPHSLPPPPQPQHFKALVHETPTEIARRLYFSHGIPAFFRGVSPTAIKAFPASAVGFAAYELTLRLLPD